MNENKIVPGTLYATPGAMCLILSVQKNELVNANHTCNKNMSIALFVVRNMRINTGKNYISYYKYVTPDQIFSDKIILLPEIAG